MKERLTGAIILVALIVVLVPELLSGPIRPAAHARGPGPSAEEPPLRSITIDMREDARGGSGELAPQPASPPTPVAQATEPAAAPQAAPSQAPDGANAVADQAPPAKNPPAAAAPASAASHPVPPASPAATGTSSTGWVVQLGSFANRPNAERLAQKVHALGFPVMVSRGTTGQRLYRVQVGPAHDHAAAEQILSKLRAQGYKGPLVPK